MNASTALDARGLKRVCVGCGSRFYDMNKRPIACPKCNTEFTGEIKMKGRRGRVAAEPEKKEAKVEAANQETEEIESSDDVVSLDDVEDMENEDANDDDDENMDLGDGDLEDLDDLDVIEDDEEDEDLDVPVEKED